MDHENKTRFATALGALAEVHGKKISKMLLTAYFETLKGFSIDQVEAGISKAFATSRFFPKPVELIETIAGSPADKAEVEASKAINAVKRVGSYQSVVFDDPVTMATIRQGFEGWVKFAEGITTETEKWVRKDFIRIYCAYVREGLREYGYLPGISEIHNSAHCAGVDCPPPILIGDYDSAQAVLEHRPRPQLEGVAG